MTKQTDQSIGVLLPLLMREIGDIGKDRRNQHQNYQFRGIDDVLNHVGPACAKIGIRVSVTIHDHVSNVHRWTESNREKFSEMVSLKMRLEFIAPDGTSHVSEAIGSAMDTQGDKACAKALSGAFKYACFMGLVIPVEGALEESDNDPKQPDSLPEKGRANTSKPASPPKEESKPSGPVNDQTVEAIQDLWEKLGVTPETRSKQVETITKKRTTNISETTESEAVRLLQSLEAKAT